MERPKIQTDDIWNDRLHPQTEEESVYAEPVFDTNSKSIVYGKSYGEFSYNNQPIYAKPNHKLKKWPLKYDDEASSVS